tara:strand:- start:454 stop:999 length:546 start_codon:yes stop_codon:yes gene_type:complete
MENQESNLTEDNGSTAVLEDNQNNQDSEDNQVDQLLEDKQNTVNEKKVFPTDQELITSILEDAFPKGKANQQLGIPQSDTFSFASRIFFLWVWPIVLHNKVRNLINNMNFAQPYSDPGENTYAVKDTETVYTMTKDAFAGRGGMKFMGIRFMSIWVFPFAIMGAVMEFLFVGPLKGTNPFG